MNNEVFFSLLGKLISILALFVFTPIYIYIIGETDYGIIAFYGVLINLIAVLDAGMTATITREMASSLSVKNSETDYKSYFVTLERVYFLLLLFIIAILIVFSGYVIENNLKSDNSIFNVYLAICAAAIFNMLWNFYLGALFGRGKIVRTNIYLIILTLFRYAVVVPVIYFSTEKLFNFFAWIAFVNLIGCLFLRFFLLNVEITNGLKFFNWSCIKDNYVFSIGLIGITLAATINLQFDKLFVNIQETLIAFTAYALAASFSQIPTLFASPVGKAMYPLMVKFAEDANTKGLELIFYRCSFFIMSALFMLFFAVFALNEEIILFWLREESLAARVAMFNIPIFLGFTAIGLQVIPFYVALAHKNTRITFIFTVSNAISTITVLPLVYTKLGILGVAYGFCIINCVILPLYTFVVLRKFLPDVIVPWCKSQLTFNLLTLGIACFIYSCFMHIWQEPSTINKFLLVVVTIALMFCSHVYKAGGVKAFFLKELTYE